MKTLKEIKDDFNAEIRNLEEKRAKLNEKYLLELRSKNINVGVLLDAIEKDECLHQSQRFFGIEKLLEIVIFDKEYEDGRR